MDSIPMNPQKPRSIDRQPWQPGAIFLVQPLDVASIRVRFHPSANKADILRYWTRIAESVADHAIGKMLRSIA